MEDFLEYTHLSLNNLAGFETIHVVMGNEACDLDSAASAIVYAYYLSQTTPGRERFFLPLLNMKRKELRTRTEIIQWLKDCHLMEDHLIFRDMIDFFAITEKQALEITLVDHNMLTGDDAQFNSCVVCVIDHHQNERPQKETADVHIEMVGSCCTLVAELCLKDEVFRVSPQLAQLLYGPILLDTINLSETCGKKTEKDVKIITTMEKFFPQMRRDKTYMELQKAKFNLSGLSNVELFTRDLKVAKSQTMDIAVSSITINIEELLKRPRLRHDMRAFLTKRELDVLVILTIHYRGPNKPFRNIIVYCYNDLVRKMVVDVLMASDKPPLDLMPVSCKLDKCDVFVQGTVTASRKHILPILKDFLNNPPDFSELAEWRSEPPEDLSESDEDENGSLNDVCEDQEEAEESFGEHEDQKTTTSSNDLLSVHTSFSNGGVSSESLVTQGSSENDQSAVDFLGVVTVPSTSVQDTAPLEKQDLFSFDLLGSDISQAQNSSVPAVATSDDLDLFSVTGTAQVQTNDMSSGDIFGNSDTFGSDFSLVSSDTTDVFGLNVFAPNVDSVTGNRDQADMVSTDIERANNTIEDSDPFGLGLSNNTTASSNAMSDDFPVSANVRPSVIVSESEDANVSVDSQKDIMEDFDPFSSTQGSPVVLSGYNTPTKRLESEDPTSQYSSYPSTPPSSFVESNMAHYAKETVLPSFNNSEMVQRIKDKKDKLVKSDSADDDKGSSSSLVASSNLLHSDDEPVIPFTPSSSYQESSAIPTKETNLPSFMNSEMVQKIHEKRGELGGSAADSDPYPFTPRNSFCEGDMDTYGSANGNSAAFLQSNPDELRRLVHEKKRSIERDLSQDFYVDEEDVDDSLAGNENETDVGSSVISPQHVNNVSTECSTILEPEIGGHTEIVHTQTLEKSNDEQAVENSDNGTAAQNRKVSSDSIQNIASVVTQSIISAALDSFPVDMAGSLEDTSGTAASSQQCTNDGSGAETLFPSVAITEHAVGSEEIPVETDYLCNVDPLKGQMDIIYTDKKSFATDAVKDVAESTSFEQLQAESAGKEKSDVGSDQTVEEYEDEAGNEVEKEMTEEGASETEDVSEVVETSPEKDNSLVVVGEQEIKAQGNGYVKDGDEFGEKIDVESAAGEEAEISPVVESAIKLEESSGTETAYEFPSPDGGSDSDSPVTEVLNIEQESRVNETLSVATSSPIRKSPELQANVSIIEAPPGEESPSRINLINGDEGGKSAPAPPVGLMEDIDLGQRGEAEGAEINKGSRTPSMSSEEIALTELTEQILSEDDDKVARPQTLDASGGAVPKKKIHPNLTMLDDDAQSYMSNDVNTSSILAMIDDMKTPDDLTTPDFDNSVLRGISTEDDTTPTGDTTPIPEYSAADELADERHWRSVTIAGKQYKVDMKVIEPYKKVLSHGGYYNGCNAIVVFAACYMPDRSRKDYHYVMDQLFLYVVSTLELLVVDDYMIIYFHGATPKKQMPGLSWLKKCYQCIDRRLRKNLKKLYLVHPTMWLKTIMFLSKPFISSKFYRKVVYVPTLSMLSSEVNLEYVYIPNEIRRYDSKLYAHS